MAEYKSNYTGQQIDAGIAKANSAVQPNELNNYQTKIDSSHKLSADLILDGSTNKTVTATEKTTWNNKGTYSKPNDGIPKTDLNSLVQTSLEKADSALQSYTEQYTGTISSVKMNGSTISTSGEADLGTVITEHQDLSGYQTKIDSSHKLSADLVDDTSTTNKFVTASDKTTWDSKSVVNGTNDGTNWSTITINGTTKNIPLGGGSATDVQINGTSIVSDGVANIVTETAYNASTNKIATVSDLPDITTKQDTLVSGINIKTVNGDSVLGSGNLSIPQGTTVTANPTLTGHETNLDSIQIGNVKYSVGGELVDKTVAGTELDITDNFNAEIKNLKIYGHTNNGVATTPITIDKPGYLHQDNLEIITTQTTSSYSDYIEVNEGDVIELVNAKTRASGCCLLTYNSSKVAQASYFKGTKGSTTVIDYSGQYFIVPSGIKYVVVAGLNTTSGAVAENPSINLLQFDNATNLFDINNFDWVGTPGYVSSTGVWTPTAGAGSGLNIFAITKVKIPVTPGHRYYYRGLTADPKTGLGQLGPHWFSSSYTAIDTTNTTTAQTGWLSRNTGSGQTSGVFIAPQNAAYCEFQGCDQTTYNSSTQTYSDATKAGLETSLANFAVYDLDDTGTVEMGTIYINNEQTTTDAQSVDLSAITISTSADFVYKKPDGNWYSNIDGVDTQLSSSYQSSLEALELYLNDHTYLWQDNGGNLELTYLIKQTGGGGGTTTKKHYRVLLLTNSFGCDSFSYVPSLMNNLVGNDIDLTIGMLYIGGCTLQRHWTEISGNTTAYTYYETTNNGAWTSTSSCSALPKLKKENWDLFIFNQLSTATVDETTFAPYLGNIMEWVFNNANKPVKFGLFFGGSYPSATAGLTIETMYTQSIPVLQDILDDYPIEIFFPNGTAIQNARTNNTLDALGATGHLLYDNLHAQEGIPCLIEAYTVVLGLLEILRLDAVSIVGDKPQIDASWLSSHSIPGQHGSPVGVTNANIFLAQKCAIMAHKKPFEVTTIE